MLAGEEHFNWKKNKRFVLTESILHCIKVSAVAVLLHQEKITRRKPSYQGQERG